MAKGTIITGLLAVFVLAVGLRLALSNTDADGVPAAQGGVIDLRQWDFEASGAVALKGEWLFEAGTFASPLEFEPSPSAIPVRVPGSWDRFVSPSGIKTPFGYGTYRLRILLPQGTDRLFGIRIGNVRSSHELYANGMLVGRQGTPGTDRSANRAANAPYVASMTIKGGSVQWLRKGCANERRSQAGWRTLW